MSMEASMKIAGAAVKAGDVTAAEASTSMLTGELPIPRNGSARTDGTIAIVKVTARNFNEDLASRDM